MHGADGLAEAVEVRRALAGRPRAALLHVPAAAHELIITPSRMHWQIQALAPQICHRRKVVPHTGALCKTEGESAPLTPVRL